GVVRGQWEQHGGAWGGGRVGDEEWEVDGFGLRDHSWGPRYWQSPWWYRWLTANFGEEFGFVISIVTSREGGQRIGGVVLEDGEYRTIDDAKIETEWRGADSYHQERRAVAHTADPHYEIEGSALSLTPPRNRTQMTDAATP